VSNADRVREMMRLVDEMRIDELIDYFADDAVMELLFAPSTMPKRYEGREEILGFQRFVRDAFSEFGMELDAVHQTTDPRVVIAEHHGDGVVAANGRPYRNRYITRFEFDVAGRVVLWREYYDAGAVVKAFRPG
jgi:hypothetical protein